MSATNMGTLGDLQKQLRLKDDKIAKLQKQVQDRDAQIQELRSELDKHISIMKQQGRTSIVQRTTPRRRAVGVTGDHLSVKEVKDMTAPKKHQKSQRSVTVTVTIHFFVLLVSVSIIFPLSDSASLS